MKKLLLLLLFALFACERNQVSPEDSQKTDYLVFGNFYGFCIGKCVEMYRIDETGVYVDTEVDAREFYSRQLDFKWQKLSDEKYEAVKNLTKKIPSELLNADEQTFGIPDAHDQGGWYVEVIQNRQKESWKMDTVKERLPAYLQAFVADLENAKEALRK